MLCKKDDHFTVAGSGKKDNALGNVIEKKFYKKRGYIATLMYFLVKEKKLYYSIMVSFSGIIQI